MAGNEIIVGNWSRHYAQLLEDAKRREAKSKPRERYIKPQALLQFEKEYNDAQALKYPKIPPQCRARYTFSDKTANELTKAIITHLRFNGYFAARVNSTGVYDQRRGLWRTSNARKGLADITAVIAGRSVQLEIKAGNDRPRTAQMQVQAEVQAAGGVYEFVHNFAEYIELYNRLTGKPPNFAK